MRKRGRGDDDPDGEAGRLEPEPLRAQRRDQRWATIAVAVVTVRRAAVVLGQIASAPLAPVAEIAPPGRQRRSGQLTLARWRSLSMLAPAEACGRSARLTSRGKILPRRSRSSGIRQDVAGWGSELTYEDDCKAA